MRTNDRLLELRNKYAPDYKPDFTNESTKFFVGYNHYDRSFFIDCAVKYETLGVIYFPEHCIEQVIEDLEG